MLGGLWRDAGWPVWLAAAAALAVGAAGGALNAWFVARWRLPPLMVTLGSLSLFRGLAEGLTGGVDNYTSLPPHFLALGQGFAGAIPIQAPVLLAAALGTWLLVHRTTRGRVYFAVGNNEQAARFAGVDVARHLAELYILSGLAAGLAAIIYVAHLGQAKADAGTGYELTAVTAVVLGGTAINGGSGSVLGTLLGLAAMVVLQNGLRLAALPAELAGILTGALLLGAIGLPALRRLLRSEHRAAAHEDEMRNSQLAVLCGVILAGALIVAGSNWWLVHSLQGGLARPHSTAAGSTADRRDDGTGRGRRDDAEGEGRSVLRQLPSGRGRSRGAVERRADLGWADRARSREAERGCRGLDYSRRQRRRGQRREPGGDFHRVQKGAHARESRCSRGTPTRSPTRAISW